MDRWRPAKSKLGAVHAINGHRGGRQDHDLEYDAQPIQEPKDPPPPTSSSQTPRYQGLNMSYYQQSAWSPSQPAANVPGQQYGSYSVPPNSFGPTQGFNPLPLPQSPPVQHGYGNAQQQSSPIQGQQVYLPGNVSGYQPSQSNQFNNYTTQPYQGPSAGPQYPSASNAPMSPPQAPFAPPQRSVTDHHPYTDPSTPLQRSQTMPAQPAPHDCTQYWNQILGRCLICNPIERRLFSEP